MSAVTKWLGADANWARSPVLVSQAAARRVPPVLLWTLCAVYVMAGFVGRTPWREADMAAFGFMQAMAEGRTSWLRPLIDGAPPPDAALLPYWVGALALQLLPSHWAADAVVRLPFAALLALSLVMTWVAMYYLARTPAAQPVAFAFGGEATPRDYARVMADGALLALLACLGLAQMGHETTSQLVQMAALSAVILALARMGRPASATWALSPKLRHRALRATLALLAMLAAMGGVLALSVSGAPALALMLAAFGTVWALVGAAAGARFSWAAWWALSAAIALWLIHVLHITPIGLGWASATPRSWGSIARLLLWFTWPVWPLVLWALWVWRAQWRRPRAAAHLLVPLLPAAWVLGDVLFFAPLPDRALFVALPAVAILAAWALPTLGRSLGAMLDWLTMIFFTLSAATIWVVWLAVQTGWPQKPAANVARLAPGFEMPFEITPFALAVLATLAWLGFAVWRTQRHRPALWKSLALPAAGTTLGWVLLMTLWLPMLEWGRSFAPHIVRVEAGLRQAGFYDDANNALKKQDIFTNSPTCLPTLGLSHAQRWALRFHAGLHVARVEHLGGVTVDAVHNPFSGECASDWALVNLRTRPTWSEPGWQIVHIATRPTERDDQIAIVRRVLP